MKVLIFGSSGSVGQEVLKNLLSQNIAIHAVRRQSPADMTSGVTWFGHDLLQGPGSNELWNGVTHVFLMSPPGYTQQDKILIPVIEKAREKNIQKLVLMTAMGANHALGSPMQKSEDALRKSALNYAIIRPNWCMQNFHSYWGEALRAEQTVLVPAGAAKTSFIDVRDIGAVAARLLTTSSTGEFDLTGSESLTHAEVASILSESLNQHIRYVDAEPKAFQEILMKTGMPEDYAAFLMIILGALREGHVASISDNVEKILQRQPLRFADYARDFSRYLR